MQYKKTKLFKKPENFGSTVDFSLGVDPMVQNFSQTSLQKLENLTECNHENVSGVQKDNPISILRRKNTDVKPRETLPCLNPRMPYHKRLELYFQKRDEIFNVSAMHHKFIVTPKRSTLRMRKFFKLKKLCRNLIVSTIISNPKDRRLYAKVNFLHFSEYGLLDTGANISCVGAELALNDFSKYPTFSKCKSIVKTADGQKQRVEGWIYVDVSFRGKSKPLRLFIIPTISQKLILGIDFWQTFDLISDYLNSIDLLASDQNFPEIQKLNTLQQDCKIAQNLEQSLEGIYPLTIHQRNQLDSIIEMFPNFHTQGLGRTKLINHVIDVGDATPIKQRFYPVSPAVEKLMFGEIDRMLELGVIEPSTSAWSSPMRLVVKPGKVRLCLDARKLNSVTKKDAYPLPNIEGIFSRLPQAN